MITFVHIQVVICIIMCIMYVRCDYLIINILNKSWVGWSEPMMGRVRVWGSTPGVPPMSIPKGGQILKNWKLKLPFLAERFDSFASYAHYNLFSLYSIISNYWLTLEKQLILCIF